MATPLNPATPRGYCGPARPEGPSAISHGRVVPGLSGSTLREDRTRFSAVTLPAYWMILSRTEQLAMIRAAQITLRRAILQNFSPGLEREKRLQWLAEAVSSRQEPMRALKLLEAARSGAFSDQ